MFTKSDAGFTLMELLIGVAVLALVISFAIPSYQNYIRENAMRTAGQVVLKDALFMEAWRNLCGNYARDSSSSATPACFTGSSSSTSAAWPTLPYLVAPESGATLYRISFSSTSPGTVDASDFNGFRLKATPLCNTIVANSGCVCVDQDNNIIYDASENCNNATTLCPCTD